MISLSKKTVSNITKIGLASLVVYTLGFAFYKVGTYYKTYFEKEKLLQELQIKKNETNSLKRQIKINQERIENLKASYIKKEELELKMKDIFQRMSLFDYELKFLDAKNMCIDRFVIVAQVSAESENGKKAGEGILSYLGKIKQSEQNDTIYFVDYISQQREIKK